MLEELSSDGKWWLPNKDSIQFSGTLTFDPKDGGILTVSALTELFFKAGLSHDIHDFLMLGELFDGSKVTLHI
jgi:hypothetical protein